jgi:hypothetical protein
MKTIYISAKLEKVLKKKGVEAPPGTVFQTVDCRRRYFKRIGMTANHVVMVDYPSPTIDVKPPEWKITRYGFQVPKDPFPHITFQAV